MDYDADFNIDYSQRNPVAGLDEIFYQRWSPRSFKKTIIPEKTLATIFDAARWSPSCFNAQPWRFITSTNELEFSNFLMLLSEKNQLWAKNASLLGFICSKNKFDHADRINQTSAFDTGAAWMAMTLQARKFGLYTHAMAGIDKQAAYKALEIEEKKYTIQCAFALGAVDKPEQLAQDFIAKEKPSSRKPLEDIWHQGSFDS